MVTGLLPAPAPAQAGGTTRPTTDARSALGPYSLGLEDDSLTLDRNRASSRDMGLAVAEVRPADLTERPALLSDLLQGRFTGLEVTGGSTEAGQGRLLRIRGNGSIMLSNQPLVYIDGIRMMEGAFPASPVPSTTFFGRGAYVSQSPLDMINPSDVERIEIHRGPAATTRLGVGGGNGVIEIFTRRGTAGPPKWTAEMRHGTGWVPSFGANGVDYLHMEHFLRDAWWGGGYEGGSLAGDCVTDDARWRGVNGSPGGTCSWPGAQWYQTYLLSVAGGGPEADYFLSGQYQDDTYALPKDALAKVGLRGNLTLRPSRAIELTLNTAYATQHTTNTPSGNNAEGMQLNAFRQEANYLGSADPRDIAVLLSYGNEAWSERLTTSLGVEYAPGSRAVHHLTAGYDFSRQDSESLREVGFPTAPQGSATYSAWQRRLATIDYVGTLPLELGSGVRAGLSWGGQAVGDEVSVTAIAGEGLPGPGAWSVDAASSVRSVTARDAVWSAGIFAQATFALADRYFLSAAVRLDEHRGSAADFGLEAFPKLGVGWAVSEEGFWPGSIGTLRLRGAYGRSGAVPVALDPAFSTLGNDPSIPVATPRLLGPEVVAEVELGLDASWLNDRVELTATRYRQTTSRAFVSVARIPSQTLGLASVENLGRLRNTGVELQLDAEVVRSRDWSVAIGIGLATLHSEVLDLGGSPPYNDLNGRIMVGQPVPVNWGRRVTAPDAVVGPWNSSRYKVDANGLAGGNLPLGPQLPTHVLTPSLSARVPGNVVLAVRGDYRGGNRRFVSPIPISRSVRSPLCYPYYLDPLSSIALRPETPDLWRERCTPAGGDDYWFDADYFRLRNVSASFPLGFAFTDRISSALLTLTLANAWSWYREIPWWDPEILANAAANDDGLGSAERVPAPATFTLGLRVTF